MTAATGFAALYRRRLSVSLSQPAALAGQILTPVLWVLVVGPALNRAFGGFTHQVDYTSYVSLGQIVFILPFSAMFAGLTTLFDRDFGIMRELLVAPIHRAVIPLANTAVVLTVAAGQFAIIVGLALARGAHFATTPAQLLTALAAPACMGWPSSSSTQSKSPRHSARSSPPSAPPRMSCAAPSTPSPFSPPASSGSPGPFHGHTPSRCCGTA